MSSFNGLVEVNTSLKRPLRTALVITSFITLLSVSAVFFIQPEIPIFYSLPLISQQIASRYWILLFPGLSFGITLLHMVLIGVFNKVDEEVLRIFCWLTVVLQSLLLIILIRLLFLVL